MRRSPAARRGTRARRALDRLLDAEIALTSVIDEGAIDEAALAEVDQGIQQIRDRLLATHAEVTRLRHPGRIALATWGSTRGSA